MNLAAYEQLNIILIKQNKLSCHMRFDTTRHINFYPRATRLSINNTTFRIASLFTVVKVIPNQTFPFFFPQKFSSTNY